MFLGNIGLYILITEDTISVDDYIPLGNIHKQKQPCHNIEVYAREDILRGQVPLDRVGSKHS